MSVVFGCRFACVGVFRVLSCVIGRFWIVLGVVSGWGTLGVFGFKCVIGIFGEFGGFGVFGGFVFFGVGLMRVCFAWVYGAVFDA